MKNPKNDSGALGNILATPRYTECYSNLAKNRIMFVSEDVTKDLASSLSAMLMYYDNENEDEDITMYINTNGGDGDALLNIYDVMQMINSPIKTICIGKAYSAGAFMLAAGTKGKRFITKNASVMIHGLQCNVPTGDQKNSEIYFKHLQNYNNILMERLAKHTGKIFETVVEDCKKDNFLDAKEALGYGIVDKII
jgi:ATP-dependent Clp protease protease subunit